MGARNIQREFRLVLCSDQDENSDSTVHKEIDKKVTVWYFIYHLGGNTNGENIMDIRTCYGRSQDVIR